ncbi:hypothetical protein SAICODRAFT_27849 [Saitoella complicata NRRL Y-17804]|uniref:uncharacterized protein n=1 Tax=Saitoella complicata (strain BCRC 22490 / CBS 7301 / JCM 7358 / NBRC 10748 / NRRL Y-17804) TaxID=698492 RepID=UPI00086712AE|nr:uncharacterized protein SAICODRAFT_27849 [Saitoella complicata NRRL Y-17804]ODQ50155.1 hypothetical protein SAICODRAFT_27849 [Saitoella complicata NRRL Y-17804]
MPLGLRGDYMGPEQIQDTEERDTLAKSLERLRTELLAGTASAESLLKKLDKTNYEIRRFRDVLRVKAITDTTNDQDYTPLKTKRYHPIRAGSGGTPLYLQHHSLLPFQPTSTPTSPTVSDNDDDSVSRPSTALSTRSAPVTSSPLTSLYTDSDDDGAGEGDEGEGEGWERSDPTFGRLKRMLSNLCEEAQAAVSAPTSPAPAPRNMGNGLGIEMQVCTPRRGGGKERYGQDVKMTIGHKWTKSMDGSPVKPAQFTPPSSVSSNASADESEDNDDDAGEPTPIRKRPGLVRNMSSSTLLPVAEGGRKIFEAAAEGVEKAILGLDEAVIELLDVRNGRNQEVGEGEGLRRAPRGLMLLAVLVLLVGAMWRYALGAGERGCVCGPAGMEEGEMA